MGSKRRRREALRAGNRAAVDRSPWHVEVHSEGDAGHGAAALEREMAVGKGAADPAPVPLHASARPKLSKAQQRKLRQVEKKHASKNVTSVLYAQLEQNALPASAAALL